MTTLRLATRFNEMVQWDILFHRKSMISSLVDEATRWSVAAVIENKEAITIITSVTLNWIRPHSPMRLLIADRESGLVGEEAAQWLDRWQIQIKTKEP